MKWSLPSSLFITSAVLLASEAALAEVVTSVPRLRELDRSATTMQEWLSQTPPPPQALIQVTGIRLNPTDAGLEIVLQTASPTQLQAVQNVEGRTLTIDINNAILSLPNQQPFQSETATETITAIQLNNNRIQVQVVGKTAVPNATVIAQPNPVSQQPDEDEEEITVTGTQTPSYRVPNAPTAAKIDVPLRDLPVSVQVIPKEVIRDRQVVRLNELADNVSGVQRNAGYGGLSSQNYTVRGFELGETSRNGFRDFAFISPRDVANVERVEFLKGPASVLYGGGFNFSGLVNTVTKRPLAEQRTEIGITAGSYNFYRPTIDITGSLTEDKTLLYRLNVAYENAGSFRDFGENESIFVAPVLTWRLGPNTTLTTEFNYQNYDYVFDRGLLPDPVFLNLPRNRYLFEPDFNRARFTSKLFTYDFEHRFNDNWRFRQGLSSLNIQGEESAVTPRNYSRPFLEPDGRTFARDAQRSDEEQVNFGLQNEVYGKFNTGTVKHNFLFGVEYSYYRFAYDFFDAANPPGSIDIFNPQYGSLPSDFFPSSGEEYGVRTVGIYIQDLAELTPNLKFLAGLRYDIANTFYRDTLESAFDYSASISKLSPRVGLVYQPSLTTALYASWGRSFSPEIFSRLRGNVPAKPATGEQIEVGIKQDFFKNRLSATLALYQLTRQNVLTPDPLDPDFSIQTGEQKSRGVELDIAGELSPGWNVIATYAYTDAFVSKDNDLPVGDRLSNVPKHSASLWTTYEIQSGNLQGLGFGAGLVFASDREVQIPNTIQLPSYVRGDASIFYRRDRWRAAINVKNLFNTKYFQTQGFFVTPEAPFTVLGSLSVQF
ncbi:MAG: TonB-dependent siderophore receptor [Plectolyngbya sp. WJT66-NPBG17]|jgi:iron complex outermembrane receptor protein|nr:TonB-dependent siderophore receptor [Plectolyngbya sp. WJT66-NPBG17]